MFLYGRQIQEDQCVRIQKEMTISLNSRLHGGMDTIPDPEPEPESAELLEMKSRVEMADESAERANTMWEQVDTPSRLLVLEWVLQMDEGTSARAEVITQLLLKHSGTTLLELLRILSSEDQLGAEINKIVVCIENQRKEHTCMMSSHSIRSQLTKSQPRFLKGCQSELGKWE